MPAMLAGCNILSVDFEHPYKGNTYDILRVHIACKNICNITTTVYSPYLVRYGAPNVHLQCT